jgi:intracellular multiplication protein IcmV
MGFFRGMGKMIKPLVNVPKWMNAKQITNDASYISDIAKVIFKPKKAGHEESFEEAMKRLKLTEADLKQRYSEFRRLSIIFGIVFLCLLAYAVYLLLGVDPEASWRAIALSFVVSLIALIQFFRFHYWIYQIKQRRLGCGLKEYFLRGLLSFKS